MVLKRLFVTTLGALGLGAFVAGTATAQSAGEGNIPAPNLFDDQIECSMNVQTPPAALGMALDTKIMTGMGIEVDAMGAPTNANGNDDSALANLVFVIPPTHSNCGTGMVQAMIPDPNNAGQMVAAVDTDGNPIYISVKGAIPTDVAEGYTATYEAFVEANAADGAVEDAQKLLNALPATATAVQRAALQTTLDKAVAVQSTAHAKLYATGAGPIYTAGIAEWRAKGAVEGAIGAWNTAVTGAETAEGVLNPMANAEYVPLGDSDQIDGLFTGDDINLVNLRRYANANGDNSAVQDPVSGDITMGPGNTGTVGNFDAAGNLLVPMELWDHDGDDGDADATPEVLRATPVSMTYMQINGRLDEVKETVTALKKFQTDNKNALLNPVVDVAVQRAEAEQAYYQAQFDAMVADATDRRSEDEKGEDHAGYVAAPYSLKSRYGDYTAATTTWATTVPQA